MTWIKTHKKIIIGILISFICIGLIYFAYFKIYNGKIFKEKIVYMDSTKTANVIYDEGSFSDLKKENKELYDSLKKYKDQITYLLQFKYKKEYDTGKIITKYVVVNGDSIAANEDSVKVYEYGNNENDTIHYNLKIGSKVEPNWYQLRTVVNEKFTIVNKKLDDGVNKTTIDTQNKGDVTDITILKKKEKAFWKRFSIGIGTTAGYDPINKNFGIMIGPSVTFDLTK